MSTARAQIELLLKARKLDVTDVSDVSDVSDVRLTSASPLFETSVTPACEPGVVGLHGAHGGATDDLAETGVSSLDAALGGGLRRGHLSEIVGGRSSGRTAVVCRALGAAVSRGELVALVDTWDRFDPESAASTGLDLSQLLWIRETGDTRRALKAMNLVLQAGGFGLVVLDLADVPLRTVRSMPFTTWFRLARVIEGSPTVALLVAAEHLARSSGGATIAMPAAGETVLRVAPTVAPARRKATLACWTGRSDRARLLQGLDSAPRVVGARR